LQLRDLPDDAKELLAKLNAPPRLIAHHALVHDAAFEILDKLRLRWHNLKIDLEAVLFGAATHDAGKCLHRHELTTPGNRHEQDGPALLQEHGVSIERSRFSRTHGAWNKEPTLGLEDLLVALADNCWKGSRNEILELKIAEQIASAIGIETWEAFMGLDEVVAKVASRSEERLALQGRTSV
jgi:hypothetical protein